MNQVNSERNGLKSTSANASAAELAQTNLTASILRISFRNDETGWTVAKASARDDLTSEPVTITGSFAMIQEGQRFELFGSWSVHPHYGKQFKVQRAVPLRPTTKDGIVRFLGSGIIRGIGPKTAEKIYAKFGTKTLDILDANPQRLLEVTSIGRKKVDTIVDAWASDRASNEILVFLSTHGISTGFAQKIFKTYGNDAIRIVSENPYRLAQDIYGIGFRSADQIARDMGIAPDSPERIRAAVVHYLGVAEDQGHCFLSTAQLEAQLISALELTEDQVRPRLIDGLNILVEQNLIACERSETDEGQHDVYYRFKTFLAEVNTAAFLQELLAQRLVVDQDRIQAWMMRFMDASQTMLSEAQSEAVVAAVSSRVFILTGGPGVGKTTTANTIIRLFKAMGKTVALCAPTGRAAQRLTEVSSLQARTIHRLLEWSPQDGGFLHDEISPLTAQVVIVDEASMLDIHLADSLIRAVPKTAQLVFIGDVDQLPSVGPGAVLADLILSQRLNCIKLHEIFRQSAASAIVRTAHAINRGEYPEFDNQSDCRFIEVDTPEAIRGVIRQLLREELPDRYGFHPRRDVQILTPMNRGELGTQALNDEIQDLLNPKNEHMQEFTRGDLKLRPGDKVIQNVNNYDMGVFNGDIGVVEHANIGGGKVIVRFGDRSVTYASNDVLELRLAYAITIHKSQGSEFPVVVIPCSMQHFVMLQRNLFYTALTRAKKLAIFVGTRKAFAQAIQNQTSKHRQSLLQQRLRGRQ